MATAKILETANANENDEQQNGSAQNICGAQGLAGGFIPRNDCQGSVARQIKEH